jgi:hypothetical protein
MGTWTRQHISTSRSGTALVPQTNLVNQQVLLVEQRIESRFLNPNSMFSSLVDPRNWRTLFAVYIFIYIFSIDEFADSTN